ncbi:MAG: hypothetical protein ACYC3X_28005 [Pirellulaceae bacterium]
MMTIITLPPEIEGPLIEEAQRRGTTPERLVLDSLRQLFVPVDAAGNQPTGSTLFDFLGSELGTIDGTAEALSEKCGQRFSEGLVERQQRGRT